MTELERALVEVGRDLELPSTPDVVAAVGARLHRRRGRHRLLAAAVAVLLALGVALAVPPARSAILRVLHIRGAEVSLVERLPEAPARADLPGRPATLAEAPFPVLLPDGERPDAVRLVTDGVWLRYGSAERPRLVVAEIRTGAPAFLKQAAAARTTVRSTRVGGAPAIWLEGDPHVLTLPGGASRLAGNTLLWQRGELTLRLEGALAHDEAVELALAFG